MKSSVMLAAGWCVVVGIISLGVAASAQETNEVAAAEVPAVVEQVAPPAAAAEPKRPLPPPRWRPAEAKKQSTRRNALFSFGTPEEDAAALEKDQNWGEIFYNTLIKERLSVGARYTTFKFEGTTRPEDETRTETFLGYINTLEHDEDASTVWVVGYEVCRYLALEYSRDEVSARTQNFNNLESDGVVKMSGPIYVATLRIPLRDWLVPYVGIGYAPWKAEFDHEQWWMLGYSSEESYIRQGHPTTPSNGHRRLIQVEDDSSQFYVFGVSVRLLRHVELDVMMRKLELTSKAGFYHEYNGKPYLSREGEFPMDHTSYGIALKAVF